MNTEPTSELSLFESIRDFVIRLNRSLGPVAVGLILDFLDVATLGPIGLFGGVIVGAAAGWWLGSLHGLSTNGRIVLATLAGVYLTIPFTEPLPIATVVGAAARFWRSGKKAEEMPEEGEDLEGKEGEG